MVSYEGLEQGRYMSSAIFLSILALTWYFTFFFKRFWIEEDRLFIRSISGTKAVDIKSIRKLETDTFDWVGAFRLTVLRPYRKGLLLHYNQIDNIFVHPENAPDFIEKLRQISPSIEIIETK
jgi:hypothetical protein